MGERRDWGIRELLGFDPVALIVDYVAWKLRWAGQQIITGVVLIIGLAVMAAALFMPLLLTGLLIEVFGLAVEPYKWIGTILIVLSFAVGIIAAPMLLRRVIRRGRKVIALTEFGGDDGDGHVAAGPSPIVLQRPTREQWKASIKALDDRISSPPDRPS